MLLPWALSYLGTSFSVLSISYVLSTLLCAPEDFSPYSLFALWLQGGSVSKRNWQQIKGQEEREGEVLIILAPFSLNHRWAEAGSFPERLMAVRWPSPADAASDAHSSSLWASVTTPCPAP